MFSIQKITLLIAAITSGFLCAIYMPLTDKDILGWLIGAYTALGGLLLAVMTLTGHCLTLLQKHDWKVLQFFKDTYATRIQFSALLSFLLLLTVLLLLLTYIFKMQFLVYASSFLSSMCFIYILYLPLYLSKIYIEYYEFITQNNKKPTKLQQ